MRWLKRRFLGSLRGDKNIPKQRYNPSDYPTVFVPHRYPAIINRRNVRPQSNPRDLRSPAERDRARYNEMIGELSLGQIPPGGFSFFSDDMVGSDVRPLNATVKLGGWVFDFEGSAISPPNGGYGPDPFDSASEDGLLYTMVKHLRDDIPTDSEAEAAGYPDWYLNEDGWPPLERHFSNGYTWDSGFIFFQVGDGEEFMGYLPNMLLGFLDISEEFV